FFSSRRRHTRFSRDWSSDVCSSDLFLLAQELVAANLGQRTQGEDLERGKLAGRTFQRSGAIHHRHPATADLRLQFPASQAAPAQIGRASCRETGAAWGAGVRENSKA